MSGRRAKDRTTGRGFVGRWIDGSLGWTLPRHLSGLSRGNEPPAQHEWSNHRPHYLCRITVELIQDKRGRPIVRYPNGKEPS